MWEARGSDYDKYDTFHRGLAERLVKLAQPRPGEVALDIAAGTGMVSIPFSQQVGANGHVTGVDISESMLSEAEKKAKHLGIKNLTLQQVDAEEVSFPEETFDTILCSSAMLYLQNIDDALKCFVAWLKPGGKLCFNTPQEPCVPATAIFYTILAKSLGLYLADAAAPLANKELVQNVCHARGFDHVVISTTDETMLFDDCSPEDYADKSGKLWQRSPS